MRTIKAPWRSVIVAGWLTLNVALLMLPITLVLLAPPQDGTWHDWLIWAKIPERLVDGRLYAPGADYYFVFAPLAGWILAAIVPIGYPLWWSLHLGVLPLLRDWRLIALTVLSIGFWVDTMSGSTTTFVFVAGVIALRGSRTGSLVYFALFLLMPRPVHLPLAGWLAWQRPELRWPLAGMVGVLFSTTLISGYTVDWLHNLIWVGNNNYDIEGNLSPTQLFGTAWLVIGVPLAAWLTLKGRVGLAGLAMTPYFGAPYLLNLLWELVPRNRPQDSSSLRQVART